MEAIAVPSDAPAPAEDVPSQPSTSVSATLGSQENSPAMAAPSTVASSEPPKAPTMPKTGLNLVIPKNKLSGALVPVTRSTSKWEPIEPKKEEPEQQPLPSRKTRWGHDFTQDPFVKRGRALALQTRAEQLAAQLESGNLEIDNNEATRSPSPPPLYDALGHRMNTREARKREQLDIERREAIGECLKLNPAYKPPSGYRPVPKEAKLFIPAKEHPGYNFIGLILGPRGNTQKRMEAETGTRITIRGKGAVKEGKLPLRYGKEMDGSLEDLHVHISADTYEEVDAAVAIIEPLLTPVDEQRNIHKMKQLRELAEMNGTVRELFCNICGEMGHKEWQCPRDKLQTFQAKVFCRLCGDGGHPTIDCPLKATAEGRMMDKEYLNFLQELNGIEPSGSVGIDTSQPSLLTASGAQSMPARGMSEGFSSSFGAGSGIEGGFPRFPFPGPNGMNPLDFILPRIFHPTFGIFRGRPISPSNFRMMARMLSSFMERFPFPPPPFGWRPDIRPPFTTVPEASTSSLPAETSMTGDRTQASGLAEGNAIHNNPDLFRCILPTSNAPDVKEDQGLSAACSVGRPAAVAPFSSSSVPCSSTIDPSRLCTVPQSTEGGSLSTVLPATPVSLAHATLLPMAPLPMPTGLSHTGTPSVGTVSVRPVIPSFRPAFANALQQPPSFTPLGAVGQGPVLRNSFDGSSSASSIYSSNNFVQPLQPWTNTTWNQGQHLQSVVSLQETSTAEKISSGYTSIQTYSTVNSSSTVPSNPLRPWNNMPPAGPGMIPAAQPSIVPVQYQSFVVSSAPSPVLPSFTPIVPQTSQGQFTMHSDDKLTSSSKSYNPSVGFSPLPGPSIQMPTAMLASSFSSFGSQHAAINQQNFSYQLQTTPTSQVPVGRLSHYGSPFSTSEFSYVRPQMVLYPVSAAMPRNFTPPIFSSSTVFSEQGLRQPPTFSTPPSSGSFQ